MPTTIVASNSTQLSWTTVNASKVSIDSIGDVPAIGSRAVSPAQTTTYTLTATGPEGTAKASVTVNVISPHPIVTVVFLGDSITYYWDLRKYFPGELYTNAGVSGNTTAQMLGRFGTDVLGHHADAVIVLGGTNDLKQGVSLSIIEANLQTICEQARAAGMVPILSTVLPRNASYTRRIVELNTWIKNYATAAGVTVADYYPALVDANGNFRSDMTRDGVHPNDLGYQTMTPIAAEAIATAQ